jgi:4-amino-4-deoxy-L-arabinose transferase-like glycosyltransferase
MNTTSATRWTIATILVVAFVVRVGAAFWWQSRVPAGKQFGFPDSESYWQLGQKIAVGQPYEFGPERYKLFRTPGYPLLLSGLFAVGGADTSPMTARVLSALLGTLTVWLAALVALRLYDERVAVLTSLAVAIYPEAIAPSVFVLSEAPFIPLMMVQLYCWIAGWQSESRQARLAWALAAGIAAGLATLMRPSWLLFTPFAFVIGLVVTRLQRRHLEMGLLMHAGLCLAMLPWWLYAYSVAGRFVPTSLQVGASLYDGLSPVATGASDMRFVPAYEALQHNHDATHPPPANQLFEDRLDERMKQDSIAWSRTHLRRVFELVGIKFVRIWSPLPNASEFSSVRLRLILLVSYIPAMILAAIGFWRSRYLTWQAWLLLLPAVYFTALHVIFVSSIRYRQPAMVPLLIFAAVGAVALVSRWFPAAPVQTANLTPARK